VRDDIRSSGETMSDPLTPDDAEDVSGTKDNFVGKVIGSSIDGLALEALNDGYQESSQQYESDVPVVDHFAYIDPVDGTYSNNQNILSLSVRSGRQTKWMTMMAHLFDVHGDEWANNIDGYEDIPDFIKGRVYEWMDVSWTEDEEVPGLGVTYQEIGRGNDQIKTMLVPVREVTDENELADLGVEDGGDVDKSVQI
jgi:hypothetical protein